MSHDMLAPYIKREDIVLSTSVMVCVFQLNGTQHEAHKKWRISSASNLKIVFLMSGSGQRSTVIHMKLICLIRCKTNGVHGKRCISIDIGNEHHGRLVGELWWMECSCAIGIHLAFLLCPFELSRDWVSSGDWKFKLQVHDRIDYCCPFHYPLFMDGHE